MPLKWFGQQKMTKTLKECSAVNHHGAGLGHLLPCLYEVKILRGLCESV